MEEITAVIGKSLNEVLTYTYMTLVHKTLVLPLQLPNHLAKPIFRLAVLCQPSQLVWSGLILTCTL